MQHIYSYMCNNTCTSQLLSNVKAGVIHMERCLADAQVQGWSVEEQALSVEHAF